MDITSPPLQTLESRDLFYQYLRYGIIGILAIGFFISAIVILAKDSNNNEIATWFFLTSVFLFLLLLVFKYEISVARNCWDCIQRKRRMISGSNEDENETLVERSYDEKEGSENGSQCRPFRVDKTSYGSTDETFVFPGFSSSSGHGQQTSSTDQVATLITNGVGVSTSKKSTEEGNSSEDDDDTLVDSGAESCKKECFSSKASSVDSQRSSPSLETENRKEDEKEEAPPPTTITDFLKDNSCYDSSASISSSYHTASSEPYDRSAMPQYEFSNK